MGTGFSYVEDTESTSFCHDMNCISKYLLIFLNKILKHYKLFQNQLFIVGSGESASVVSLLAQAIL
jgi:hypothetical protein